MSNVPTFPLDGVSPTPTKPCVVDRTRKTALVVEGGGVRAAYAVGVLRKLFEYGGPAQFDAIFAVSGSVFAATYFAAGQVQEMEYTWRNLVHGSLLVDYWNLLRGLPVLRLDYLIDLFKGPVRLDLEKVQSCHPSLTYILSEYRTEKPAYVNAKAGNIWDKMRASCALPIVYPRPIYIDGTRYFDGGYADPIPIEHAITEGFEEIVVIMTRPGTVSSFSLERLLGRLVTGKSLKRAKILGMEHSAGYERAISLALNPPGGVRVIPIKPKTLSITRLARDKAIICQAIDQGAHDAEVVFSNIVKDRSHRSSPDPPSSRE